MIFSNPVVALCSAWQGVRMGITPPGLRRLLQRGIRMDVVFGELHAGLVMLSFCLILNQQHVIVAGISCVTEQENSPF